MTGVNPLFRLVRWPAQVELVGSRVLTRRRSDPFSAIIEKSAQRQGMEQRTIIFYEVGILTGSPQKSPRFVLINENHTGNSFVTTAQPSDPVECLGGK